MSYIWEDWDLKLQCGDDAIKRIDVGVLLNDFLRKYENELKDADKEGKQPSKENIQKRRIAEIIIGELQWLLVRMPPMERAIPAVRQPRKGKWVQSDLDCEFVTCSYCKEHEIEGRRAFRSDYADTMNFCMICGADMRKRSEEE